ncbi:MAG TPA: alpha-ketoacid dehydrogenase subunit beta [Deferrisomatales bacterium]|nr:alpha-ketoacid dehydrogenase subunit beta [Deferrisomatales bacterium]
MAEITYREALNRALAEEMERDPEILLLGEDVAEYGGSFKVTQGLLERFGPERVFDTPISEAGIVGTAVGMALAGLRPIAELMTVNFALVAFDQIVNHLAKMYFMFGAQCPMPVTIRAPGGGGHQLGAQHSHSLEAIFSHFPGLKVVCASTPANAKSLLQASIRDDDPVIFLEHEGLYNAKGEVPENQPPVQLGRAEIVRPGSDLTLIGYGRMAVLAGEAAAELAGEGFSVEVIDLLTLRPWDKVTVAASVARTHRAVVVEECWPQCGIGAEVVANLCDRVFFELEAPIARVSGEELPAPYARELEQACIPDVPKIVAAAKRTLLI